MMEDLSPEIREKMKQAVLEHKMRNSADELSPEIRQKMKRSAYKNTNQEMSSLDILKDPSLLLKTILGNTEAGALELGRGIGNYQLKLLESLGLHPSKIGLQEQIPESALGLENIIPNESRNTGIAEGSRMAGETLPLMGLGPESKGIGMLSSALERTPQALRKVPDWLTQALKGFGANVASSPAFTPDQSLEQSYKESLLPAGIISSLVPGLQGASVLKNKLKQFGGKATTLEVDQAVEAAGPGKLAAGEAIDSPMLKRLQSYLSFVPGTGMSSYYQGTGKDLSKRLLDVMQDLKGSPTTDSANNLMQSISKKYKESKDISGSNYKELNDKAEELNQKVDLSNYHNTSQNNLDKVKKLVEEKSYYKYLKQDDDLMRFLEGASNPKKISTIAGEQVVPSKYNMATLEDVELNDLISKSIADNDKKKTGILKDLQKSLREDIENSVKKSGNEELSNLWDKSKKHYQNEVVPFQNKEILPYALGLANPDTLTKFIRTTRQSNPTQLKKLTRLLEEDEKKDLAHLYLTGGNDEYKTPEIMRAYKDLGKTIQDELFNAEHNKELRNIQSTSKILGSEKNQMFIPKNGYAGVSQKTGDLLSKIGIGTISGVGSLAATGHLPSGVMETLMMGVAGLGMGNLATKFLLSDYLKKIYKKAAEQRGLKRNIPLRAFTSPYAASMSSQDQEGQ